MLIRVSVFFQACVTILVCTLLSSCSALLAENTASDMVPDGSHLLVKQALIIPANRGRVYIQHGEIIMENQRDQYKPYCWLQSWKVLDVPQEITPDIFIIKSSRRYEELVQKSNPILLASNSNHWTTMQLSLASITAIEQNTVFSIYSDKHPDIRELVCGFWDDPADNEHLTLPEIRATLGNIINIKQRVASEN